MTTAGIPGFAVVSVTDWTALGAHLGGEWSTDQADFLGAFAEALAPHPMRRAVVAQRLLLAEKDDPMMRARREAVQQFCRELLEHLDEGSR